MNLYLEEMKRKIFSRAGLLLVAGILAACSNDDNSENDGKNVDVAKAVEFKVNFSDYNADEEVQGTRAADSQKSDTLSKQVVDLGNDILAEVTVQRDTTLTKAKPHPSTRALEDGNYTLIAYIAGSPVGEIKGFVKNGTFMHTDNNVLELAPGTYNFTLFNDKVNYSGGGYSFSVDYANAGTAIVGRAGNVVIPPSPRHQQVTFNMKHVGARMKLRLQCYMSHDGLGGKLSGTIPSIGKGDPSAYVRMTGENPAAWSSNISFPAVNFNEDDTNFYKQSMPTDYQYFFYGTNVSDLKLTLNSGTIYDTDLATHPVTIDLAPNPAVMMEGNKSYIVNVKLMRNLWYLMSDGSIGLTKETTYGGGTKTPVGIVLSRSRHLAMALKNATLNGSTTIQWYYRWLPTGFQSNYRTFPENNLRPLAYSDMDGKKYTWEAAGSADGTTVKATALYDGVHPTYPAFYAAGHYRQQLTASGITLTNGMESKDWYLPSYGEFVYIYKELGHGDMAKLMAEAQMFIYWKGDLTASAFRQVEGTPLHKGPRNGWFINSTELDHYSYFRPGETNFSFWTTNWNVGSKDGPGVVRPFINY